MTRRAYVLAEMAAGRHSFNVDRDGTGPEFSAVIAALLELEAEGLVRSLRTCMAVEPPFVCVGASAFLTEAGGLVARKRPLETVKPR